MRLVPRCTKAAPLVGLGLAFVASAQPSPTVIKDINRRPAYDTHSSFPEWFTRVGPFVYYRAVGRATGAELWRTFGAPGTTRMVKDLLPGSWGSRPRDLVEHRGKLFFSARDFVAGRELWCSDGTPTGTRRVKDIYPGPTGSVPLRLTSLGNRLVFGAATSAHGHELWATDGTAAGTRMIADINPGPASSGLATIVAVGGLVYFAADDGVHGSEVWRSDGTAAGTKLAADLDPGATGSHPVILGVLGSAILCSAHDSTQGREPWFVGSFGVRRLGDLKPGAGSSNPTHAKAHNNQLLFAADDGRHGTELWVTDGTRRGTSLLADTWIGPGSGLGRPGYATLGRNVLFSDERAGIWRTDGSPGGTTRLRRFGGGKNVSHLRAAIGAVFFTAVESATGDELWRTDGTAAGTQLVKDIWPGKGGSTPTQMFPTANGRIVFAAAAPSSLRELWVSDGTTAGTQLLYDIGPPPGATQGSSPTALLDGGELTFFAADDGIRGRELWATDHTAPGTRLVKDIGRGAMGGIARGTTFARLGNLVLFPAIDSASHGRELWRSDGTAAGTRRLRDIRPGSPDALGWRWQRHRLGRHLFFVADDGVRGAELWRTDGTSQGTALVRDIRPGPEASNITLLGALRGQLLFAADDGRHGIELWRSDGTPAGTRLLADIRPGSADSIGGKWAARLGGRMLFAADDGRHGVELWRTDGTAAGTKMVRDLRLRSGSGPRELTTVGGVVFFTADDGVTGRELWLTDGSTSGTRLVRDILIGPTGSEPAGLHAAAGRLFFRRPAQRLNRSEVWTSDGTANGTVRLRADARGGWWSRTGSRELWYTDDDVTAGNELWRTDGTPAGTRRAVDLYPGGVSSSPSWLTTARGSLVFAGSDRLAGSELFLFRPGALAHRSGHGCGAVGDGIDLRSDDPVLGRSAQLIGTNTRPGSVLALLVGPSSGGQALAPGCWLWTDPSRLGVLWTGVSIGSAWRASIPIPASAVLDGLSLRVQALSGWIAKPPGVELSNSVAWRLGR